MKPNTALSWVLTVAWCACAHGEVHQVLVGDNFFLPNDLTVRPGDTVRFNNPEGGGYPGDDALHSVTSDTGAFPASPTASAFVHEVIFNDHGEYLYHCSVHSSPGQNPAVSMNGRIAVEAAAAAFQINAGLNDAWYNPDTPGQGFFFNVFPDLGLMFIAWFTYETERPGEEIAAILGEPGHRWITGLGPFDGDTANIALELTEGGVFDSGEPVVNQTQGYGTLDLSFRDCSNASITYNIPAAGVAGEIDVVRIVSDNVPLCESLAEGGVQLRR